MTSMSSVSPFSLLELERLSAPMMRLFLTGEKAWMVNIVVKRILQYLHDVSTILLEHLNC